MDSNADWNDEVGTKYEDRLEDSELVTMTSVSVGKPCGKCGDLGSEVEVTDKTLDSSSYGMLCVNEEETFPEWIVGMIIPFSCKPF